MARSIIGSPGGRFLVLADASIKKMNGEVKERSSASAAFGTKVSLKN